MDHTQNTQSGTSTPSTPTPPAGGMPADLLARLTAAGVPLDDLTQAGLVWAEETPPRSLSRQVTLALVELERDRPGSHKTWSPYLRILVDGLPDLCPCACETCSTGPCPCRSGVHANGCLPPAGEDLTAPTATPAPAAGTSTRWSAATSATSPGGPAARR